MSEITGFLIPVGARKRWELKFRREPPIKVVIEAGGKRRMAAEMRARRISPDAGHALEILGHAIEYLSDEYVEHAREVNAADPRVVAIQLLMRLNREIYFACPVVPTIGARMMAFLRRLELRAEKAEVHLGR